MRIAITVDPEIPVPPRLYGGIERVVDMLVRELIVRGHEVTLFAHPESEVPCPLVPFPGSRSDSKRDTVVNMLTLARGVATGRFDVVHSFARIAYLLPLLPLPIPKLMTYQREITPRSVQLGHRLSRGTLQFSAISRHMTSAVRHIGHWHLVYNGVPTNVYAPVEQVPTDAPLVFLGRIQHLKGTHLAIEVARASNRRLVIAGNIPPEHQVYFDAEVKPHIDGRSVEYVGPVDDTTKNALLGSAAALLMPILWEEPFGIVMAEALACGTPVIGLRRGSVPEIVEHGVTGFVCDTAQQMAATVARLDELDRVACRRSAEDRFSAGAITEAYLSVYADLLQARRAR